MLYKKKKIPLKNGREALFRSPAAGDAPEILDNLRICAGETDFLMRYPEECTETAEQETEYLEGINASDDGFMIMCLVDGEIAGSCKLDRGKRLKTRHRARVAIGLIQKYWGLGIGSAMFGEMIAMAREQGILQLELEYVEGNERARRLYEKMGFVPAAEKPDAIRLKDGRFLKEISMIKKL